MGETSRQAPVGFHVTDHRFGRSAPPKELGNGSGDAALRTTDGDLHILHPVAAASALDEGHFRPLTGQDLDLFQRLGQPVAIARIARQRPQSRDKATPVGCGDAGLVADLVALVCLALFRRPGESVRSSVYE